MGEGQEPVVSGVPGHSAEVTTLATATTPTLPGTEPPGWPTSLRSCATSRAPLSPAEGSEPRHAPVPAGGRAAKLTLEQGSESTRKAAKARWARSAS
jgi:hypothetical protein